MFYRERRKDGTRETRGHRDQHPQRCHEIGYREQDWIQTNLDLNPCPTSLCFAANCSKIHAPCTYLCNEDILRGFGRNRWADGGNDEPSVSNYHEPASTSHPYSVQLGHSAEQPDVFAKRIVAKTFLLHSSETELPKQHISQLALTLKTLLDQFHTFGFRTFRGRCWALIKWKLTYLIEETESSSTWIPIPTFRFTSAE